MKTSFKIYVAVLTVEVLLGVTLNSVVSDEVPPTSSVTPEELQQFRQTLATTNAPRQTRLL